MSQRRSTGTKKKGSKREVHVWKQMNLNAAGIDAGAGHHFVAVPEGSCEGPTVRKFATTTRGLYELADWLGECGIETVAVEATGVYCKPLLEVLEPRFEVLLAKPSSLKSVNDRQKSDMKDCQWIQLLHKFGLLRPSYRPTPEVAAYRTINRHRQTLIGQASTAIEHIKKALTSMNVRLDQAVKDVTGKTGMSIIRAIINGERDPQVLASMRDERCAKSEAAIAEALTGKWTEPYLFELEHAVRTWDHLQQLIRECNGKLEQYGGKLGKKASRDDLPKARRIEHVRKNVLTFDARSMFFEVFGQDLTQIDGISTGTLSVLLAEVGPDFVHAFKTEKHFASWLRACPGMNRSGGKNRSGKNRKTTNRLWTALRIAAQTLSKSDSALGAFYRRKRAHLGPQKAINAAAHKMARMIYLTIKHQRPYLDPGPDQYLQRHRDSILKNMEKRAIQLGYKLVKAA